MSLGQDFAALVAELLQQDGGFGSTMRWRHVTRTENPATGAVTETTTDQVFRGAVVDPLRTKLFGESTLSAASTAVAALPSLPFVPSRLDRVEITTGRWLTVLDLKELYGPGDAGPPVLIAYMAALGGT